MYEKLRKTAFPFLAAFIWGIAFVAQAENTAGAFTFNAMRSIVATAFLLLLSLIVSKGNVKKMLAEDQKQNTKQLWIGGVTCGVFLTFATYAQQLGMDLGTEAGKASFITALYVIWVPLFGLFFRRKVPVTVWVCVPLALFGLYLICIKDGFTVRPSDLLIVACSFLYCGQILSIDHFSPFCNGIKMSCIQFMTSTVLSSACALIFETPSFADFLGNVWPVLYLGIMSSGVAYTLQIVSQKNNNPTLLTLILSMESVFGALAGALILGEVMMPAEYIGCVVVLLAVVVAQLPVEAWFKKLKK